MDGTEFVFFRLIIIFLRGRLNTFVTTAYGNVMTAAAAIAGIFFLIWILNRGYQILSGASREPMTEVTIQAAKMAAVVFILGSSEFFGIGIRDLINTFRDDLTQLVAAGGGGPSVYANVDSNLRTMNFALNIMDAVDSTGDAALSDAKARSATMALIGQASPAMVGGLLSLINEIAIGLGTIFAPIFIVALMFKQSAALFFGWVKYMVAAMITMGVLAVMVQIALDLSLAYAAAMLALDVTLTATGSSLPTLQASMMQAGLGIVLTVLLVTVPAMVGNFFGTSLGHLEYNRFNSDKSNSAKTSERAAYDASQVKTPSGGGKSK